MYNVLDVQYNIMSSQITPLDYSDPIFSLIKSAMENTHADMDSDFNISLEAIFSVNKASEMLRFMPFETRIHNKFLLWHGVKSVCLPSVLREGLKLPLWERPTQAFLQFGKGIYFTDCSSQAVRQSIIRGTKSGVGFLLLCEVALGNMH